VRHRHSEKTLLASTLEVFNFGAVARCMNLRRLGPSGTGLAIRYMKTNENCGINQTVTCIYCGKAIYRTDGSKPRIRSISACAGLLTGMAPF